MRYTYRIITLNTNGIENQTRLHMLDEFIKWHDIDIALLQEVTDKEKLTCRGYHVTANVGTTGRGTAIIHKLHIQFQRIERIPSGRGIAAYLDDACIINIYAPSGTAKRTEREEFFNTDILGLLPLSPIQLIIAGDFNCVLNNKDCTGQRTSSQALHRLINGLKLKDAWDPNINPYGFTHYTATGVTRIDRMYLSEDLICHKQGTETIAAAFTDHLAVLLRIQLATPRTLRGKGRWIMNTSFMEDPSCRRKIREEWKEWTKTIKRYLDITQWWTQFVKKRIKRLFIQERTEQNSNRRRMEDFYYSVIYDIVRQPAKMLTR